MSKHNFQETLDNESDLRKTLGYNKVYNDLKNNFLVLKMHQNAPQSMQIFKIFCRPAPLSQRSGAPAILKFPPDTFFHFQNPVLTVQNWRFLTRIVLYLTMCHLGAGSSFKHERETNYK